MAHSYVQMPIQQIEDQRAVIRQSIDIIERFTGKRPTGWLGPGRMQTFHTLDYVTEHGLAWFGDWVLDDQPLWVKTAHGPILSVPYSAEINDITMMVSHHHESDVLMTRTIDAFDRLYEESARVGAHIGDRRAPLRDRRRPPHQILRGALRLHQPARRGRALDRPGDLRLVSGGRDAAEVMFGCAAARCGNTVTAGAQAGWRTGLRGTTATLPAGSSLPTNRRLPTYFARHGFHDRISLFTAQLNYRTHLGHFYFNKALTLMFSRPRQTAGKH